MSNLNLMAPSPQQLLNEQGVRRISGFRLGTWNVGSICGRGTEVCEELRKRKVDLCCLQEVRWRGQGSRFLGVKERRYKLWWSGNNVGTGGVGIFLTEELCEKVVEIRRRSDRVMSMVLVLENEVVRVISAYAPQSGKSEIEKENFYVELESEWDLKGKNEVVFVLGDFNGHVGKESEGFDGVHGGNGIGIRNVEGRRLLEFCDQKELCVGNTWFKKKEKRKVTFRAGENQTEIDFILTSKENRKYLKDVKVIPWELQHRLVVADINKRKIVKTFRKNKIVKRRVWKLKDEEVRKNFADRVEQLVDVNADDIWKSFKEGVLQACDETCGTKRGRKSKGDTWWWNEEVKDVVLKKKTAFKAFCVNRCEVTRAYYKSMKRQAKKVIGRVKKKEIEKQMDDLHEKPNEIFNFLRLMKREGRDVEGGRCMRGKDGILCFTTEDRGKVWKTHMENIMNEENEWDHMVEVDVVEGPIEKVTQDEIIKAIKTMKPRKAAGPSEVSAELITASGEIGVGVMQKLCQNVLDGGGMPEEWKTSVVVPIFKGKGDAMSCGSYRGVKLLEHAMKIVERVIVWRIRKLVTLNENQCGFMPGKGTMDALFVVRRLQEEYRAKGRNLYMCFVDLEKAFDRVPRKVMEWAMRKKGLPEVMVKAVMSLYDGAKTKVKIDSKLTDEFSVEVGVHQGSVLSPLLFAIVVDVVTEEAREDLMWEILYADDLVLIAESMIELRKKFEKWKTAFEKKGMKVNLAKTKVMVCGLEGELTSSKIDPCGVCGKRVKINSVLCTRCKKWIHGRCAKVKRVTIALSHQFVCACCKTEKKKEFDQSNQLCDDVETVKSFCYLGDKLNASGGCEAAVTARARLGWKRFREGEELLRGRYSLKLKGKIYRTCIRPAIVYGSETWGLRESELEILRRTERAMFRAMCGVKLVERKNTIELMNMLGVKECIVKVVTANAVRWYGHVLRRSEDNILKRALTFTAKGTRARGRPRKTWLNQVEGYVKKMGLKKDDCSNRSKWKNFIKCYDCCCCC